MDGLAGVNAIAEKSDGFIWRLTDPAADAAAKALLADPRETYTLSLWRDAAALEFFVWNTVHRRFMRNRHSWFRRRPRRSLSCGGFPPARCRISPTRWRGWTGSAAMARRKTGSAGPIFAASAPGRRPARHLWAE